MCERYSYCQLSSLCNSEYITFVLSNYYIRFVAHAYLYTLLEVGTLELAGQTADGRTVQLVLLVEAVVLAVTHPRRGNTMSGVRTRELVHKQLH